MGKQTQQKWWPYFDADRGDFEASHICMHGNKSISRGDNDGDLLRPELAHAVRTFHVVKTNKPGVVYNVGQW